MRTGAVVVLLGVVLSACSSPHEGSDSYATGRERVVALVNEAGGALPTAAGFRPVGLSDTDREICHHHVLGYATSATGALQPEVTTIITLPDGMHGDDMLPPIEAAWRAAGYRVDTSALHDPHFHRLRAHAGDYTVVATSFSETAGFTNRPRVTLYAVGPCLRGGGA